MVPYFIRIRILAVTIENTQLVASKGAQASNAAEYRHAGRTGPL